MRLSALWLTHLLALCVLSAGCVPLFLPFDDWPGPRVANQFATSVEWEAKLTDGTVRRGTHRPCSAFGFFDPQPPCRIRTVFVERFTVWKDGALIGEYEGAKVEALGARGGTAVLDEKGLRRLTRSECWRLFNTLDRDVHLSARYADGSTVTMTLRHCERHVWTRDDGAVPTRMTITRDGAVLQNLDERAVRKTFKWHGAYTIGESGIAGAEWNYTAERCVECSPCKAERGQAAL